MPIPARWMAMPGAVYDANMQTAMTIAVRAHWWWWRH